MHHVEFDFDPYIDEFICCSYEEYNQELKPGEKPAA
jgi:hypothetical protein